MVRFFIASILLLSVCPAVAQEAPPLTEEALASAIYHFKVGDREIRRWRECGSYIRGSEAQQRATQYASYLMEQYRNDPEFDPWIAAAIIAQESSFDRCAISSSAMREFTEHLQVSQGRIPTERDIARLLRNPRYRSRIDVPRFDAGLAQFRWPGTEAREAGLSDPARLMDAEASIHLLANAMSRYRTACDEIDSYRGIDTVNIGNDRVRVRRYEVSCADGYWVQHNSPGRFNYQYYRNIKRRYNQLVEAVPDRIIASEESS